MTERLEEIMSKRCTTIKRDGYAVLESHGCDKTGGGVVLGKRRWGREDEIKAFYFRPRSHKRTFRSEAVTSQHERLAIRDRVRDLLQAEKEAKVAPHDLKVGEILANIWGATMRDVRFYKVVDIPHPRKVAVVQIGSRMVSGDWMSGTKVPVEDDISDGTITYMVDMSTGRPVCKTSSTIEHMTRWDGNPVHVHSD